MCGHFHLINKDCILPLKHFWLLLLSFWNEQVQCPNQYLNAICIIIYLVLLKSTLQLELSRTLDIVSPTVRWLIPAGNNFTFHSLMQTGIWFRHFVNFEIYCSVQFGNISQYSWDLHHLLSVVRLTAEPIYQFCYSFRNGSRIGCFFIFVVLSTRCCSFRTYAFFVA